MQRSIYKSNKEDIHAQEIGDLNIFVGPEESSRLKELLQQNEISHIIVAGYGLKQHFPNEFQYLELPAWDWDPEDMLRFFIPCFKFIDSAHQNNKKVLIHCKAGQSRSGCIAVGYTMFKLRIKAEEALSHLQKFRSCILPNNGFMYQLKMFERILFSDFDLFSQNNENNIITNNNDNNINNNLHYQLENLFWKFEFSREYSLHRLMRLQLEKNDGGIQSWNYFAKDPLKYIADLEQKQIKEEEKSKITIYYCKNCARPLALNTYFVPHLKECDKDDSITLDSLLNVIHKPCSVSSCALNEFKITRPVEWMIFDNSLEETKQENNNEEMNIIERSNWGNLVDKNYEKSGLFQSESGDLCCPKCDTQIGYWHWGSTFDFLRKKKKEFSECSDTCKFFLRATVPAFLIKNSCVTTELSL